MTNSSLNMRFWPLEGAWPRSRGGGGRLDLSWGSWRELMGRREMVGVEGEGGYGCISRGDVICKHEPTNRLNGEHIYGARPASHLASALLTAFPYAAPLCAAPSTVRHGALSPASGLRTEAVLSLDDDIVAPCGELDQLFAVRGCVGVGG